MNAIPAIICICIGLQVFQQTPEDVKQYMSASSREAYDKALAAQQNMKMDTLLRVSAAIGAETRLTTYGHCIIWARYLTYMATNTRVTW